MSSLLYFIETISIPSNLPESKKWDMEPKPCACTLPCKEQKNSQSWGLGHFQDKGKVFYSYIYQIRLVRMLK